MRKVILGTTLLIALISAGGAIAQGTVRGAAEGAEAGGRAAGPPGAVVGGAVGAVTGTIGGILGVDDRPRFREYVVREQRPSYRHHEEVRVGTVTYYDMPGEYHVSGFDTSASVAKSEFRHESAL